MESAQTDEEPYRDPRAIKTLGTLTEKDIYGESGQNLSDAIKVGDAIEARLVKPNFYILDENDSGDGHI